MQRRKAQPGARAGTRAHMVSTPMRGARPLRTTPRIAETGAERAKDDCGSDSISRRPREASMICQRQIARRRCIFFFGTLRHARVEQRKDLARLLLFSLQIKRIMSATEVHSRLDCHVGSIGLA